MGTLLHVCELFQAEPEDREGNPRAHIITLELTTKQKLQRRVGLKEERTIQ